MLVSTVRVREREGRREGGKERGREGGKEGGREGGGRETHFQDWPIAVSTARSVQLVEVLLTVGTSVALVIGGGRKLSVARGAGEVLRMPLTPEGVHDLG